MLNGQRISGHFYKTVFIFLKAANIFYANLLINAMRRLKILACLLKMAGLEKESRDIFLNKVSYLVRDMSDLKSYLTDPTGRGLELAELNRSAFFDWLVENGDQYSEILSELGNWEEDPWGVELSLIPESVFWNYLSSDWWRDRIDSTDLPSWDCMDYRELVTDKWLIHFTYSPHDIARDGFRFGVDNLSRLCLTTHLGGDEKKRGGFNFAYPANYKQKLTSSYLSKTGYGDGLVMFKANGIEVWHHGDEEYQVIFMGSTARDIIPIWEEDGLWWAGDYKKGFDSLEDLVPWISANFNQYRRVLLS